MSAITSEVGLGEGKFMKHVDKVHPVSGTKNGKLPRVIKFPTQSFKKKVFLKHKQNKKNENEKRKENLKQKNWIQLTFQPIQIPKLLNIDSIGLLKNANEVIKDDSWVFTLQRSLSLAGEDRNISFNENLVVMFGFP